MVFIPHEINAGGQRVLLGLTVDFFVVPEHRHAPVVIKLTRMALRIGREQGLDGVIGVPNVKSSPIVSRFMKTVPTQKLGLRVGIAVAASAQNCRRQRRGGCARRQELDGIGRALSDRKAECANLDRHGRCYGV